MCVCVIFKFCSLLEFFFTILKLEKFNLKHTWLLKSPIPQQNEETEELSILGGDF